MLQDKLMADLKEAMRKGDRNRQMVLQLLRSAIRYVEIDKQKKLDDSDVIAVISKEAKQRRESIAEFKKGNRQDLVAKEEAELNVLLEYLPKQLSHDEIVEAARSIIREVGAGGPGDKGKVMPRIMAQLKGKADGREINAVVTELLGGS